MPLFDKGSKSRHRKIGRGSILSKLKKALKRKPKRDEVHEGQRLIDKFLIMFLRTIILIVGSFSWWIFANVLFLAILPTFAVYNQWITNYGTNIFDVYQFWTVLPFIFIFVFGIFWSSGVIDLLRGNKAFQKVF